jgi:FAD/FMN-containing dehydrogenase
MHRPWLHLYLGPEELAFLEQVKQILDPKNVMNPGKLFGP